MSDQTDIQLDDDDQLDEGGPTAAAISDLLSTLPKAMLLAILCMFAFIAVAMASSVAGAAAPAEYDQSIDIAAWLVRAVLYLVLTGCLLWVAIVGALFALAPGLIQRRYERKLARTASPSALGSSSPSNPNGDPFVGRTPSNTKGPFS